MGAGGAAALQWSSEQHGANGATCSSAAPPSRCCTALSLPAARPQVELPPLGKPRAERHEARRVVVLSFDGQPGPLLQELGEFGEEGTSIVVVGEGGAPPGYRAPRGCSVRWATGRAAVGQGAAVAWGA